MIINTLTNTYVKVFVFEDIVQGFLLVYFIGNLEKNTDYTTEACSIKCK